MVHVENWKVLHAAWRMKCHEQAGQYSKQRVDRVFVDYVVIIVGSLAFLLCN